METKFTDFLCPSCHTEIQASHDMIGQSAECPACGTKLTIPEPSADGIVRHGIDELEADAIDGMKSRTIRIELGDL